MSGLQENTWHGGSPGVNYSFASSNDHGHRRIKKSSSSSSLHDCMEAQNEVDRIALAAVRVVPGSSHPTLSRGIADALGVSLTKCICEKFSNSECRVEILENVRKRNVFIIQTGSATPRGTINDHLMELLILVDACRRSHAQSITVAMPCYPYARQDKKDRPRAPISGRLVANMLEAAGVTRLMVMDLHAAQIQGFFNIPVDNLYADSLICSHLKSMGIYENPKYVLVSPDSGGVKRLYKCAGRLKLQAVIMHKQRDHTQSSKVDKTILIGEEDCVRDKVAVIIDDMADTMGTVVRAAQTLAQHGAAEVMVAVTHGVLSGPAIQRINECDSITKVIVTNTLPQEENVSRCSKIDVIDVSELLAMAIRMYMTGGSISALFQ
eukprot:GGOE01013590.1.p1 GENE.GGOE01013590.1~~GGOE01013590.1.p1  ORF type:complete len:380 (-),score=44.28 GGOE01013590.1:65-1204(-)